MVEILHDIEKLQKIKNSLSQTFGLLNKTTNDDALATLGVAIDRLENIIFEKENIIRNFEESEQQNETR